MLGDMFVIDAVVHPFNIHPDNDNDGQGQVQGELLWGLHQNWNPPGVQVPQEVFHTDWSAERLTDTLFKESAVDIAVNHHLPLYSRWKDGSAGRAKNIEIAERWPRRAPWNCGHAITAAEQPAAAQRADCAESVAASRGAAADPTAGFSPSPSPAPRTDL